MVLLHISRKCHEPFNDTKWDNIKTEIHRIYVKTEYLPVPFTFLRRVRYSKKIGSGQEIIQSNTTFLSQS